MRKDSVLQGNHRIAWDAERQRFATMENSICRLGCVIFALVITAGGSSAAENETDTKVSVAGHPVVDASTALQRLKDGNARFVGGEPRHPHEQSGWRQSLEKGQHPFACVLGCSDSRVPPELIFDQGFGDLFVIRVAGNVVDTDVTASVEYAIDHLDTELVLVMGHTHCGAIAATIDHLSDTGAEPAEVISLFNRIEPAVMQVNKELAREAKIDVCVKQNVRLAIRRLSRVPDLHRSIKAGKIKVIGAVYDMHTGKVHFLD